MADLAPIKVGSHAVQLTAGLDAGESYECFVGGPDIKVFSFPIDAGTPARDTEGGRVYGQSGNLIPYFGIDVTDASVLWAWQATDGESAETTVSRIRVE